MRSAAILEDGAFTPKCDGDGSFLSKQCYLVDTPFTTKEYCWCAMKTGERVPGTLNAVGSMWAKRTDCEYITGDLRVTKFMKTGMDAWRHLFPPPIDSHVFCQSSSLFIVILTNFGKVLLLSHLLNIHISISLL